MYYLRARYYDCAVGRFVTRDPLSGRSGDPRTVHKYAYAADNPADHIDPSGQEFTTIELAVVAAVGALLLATAGVLSYNIYQWYSWRKPLANITVYVCVFAKEPYHDHWYPVEVERQLQRTMRPITVKAKENHKDVRWLVRQVTARPKLGMVYSNDGGSLTVYCEFTIKKGQPQSLMGSSPGRWRGEANWLPVALGYKSYPNFGIDYAERWSMVWANMIAHECFCHGITQYIHYFANEPKGDFTDGGCWSHPLTFTNEVNTQKLLRVIEAD